MRPARRPPNTPGWQIPVRYNLAWTAIFIVLAVGSLFVFLAFVPDRLLGFAWLPAMVLTSAAKFAYERRPDQHPSHD